MVAPEGMDRVTSRRCASMTTTSSDDLSCRKGPRSSFVARRELATAVTNKMPILCHHCQPSENSLDKMLILVWLVLAVLPPCTVCSFSVVPHHHRKINRALLGGLTVVVGRQQHPSPMTLSVTDPLPQERLGGIWNQPFLSSTTTTRYATGSPNELSSNTQEQPPVTMSSSSLLILGMGRVGHLVAQQAAPHFRQVYGTTRQAQQSSTSLLSRDTTKQAESQISLLPDDNNVNDRRRMAKQAGADDCDYHGDETDKIREIPFDARAIQACLATSSCTYILVTTPPLMNQQQQQQEQEQEHDDASSALPFGQILSRHLSHHAATTNSSTWIGILSTTGVYGDYHGAWVTEESPPANVSSSAAEYLAWELAWRQFGQKHNCRVRVFRCAGIYGSTRSSLHTIYKRGVAASDDDEKSTPTYNTATTTTTKSRSITNRIHETDLTAAVVASMMLHDNDTATEQESVDAVSKSDFETYNLADNLPESRDVVFEYARQLFASRGIRIPLRQESTKTTSSPISKRSARRAKETKRVCNHKMKMHLLPQLSFPTYKEGLADILEHPSAPWFAKTQRRDD